MIDSDLIKDILDLSIEGIKFESQLLAQIDFLSIERIDYTGSGMYAYFTKDSGIEKYRLSESQLKTLFGEFNPMIEEVDVVNEKLEIEAIATIHVHEGLIDCLELWNQIGDYPRQELLTYKLIKISTDNML